MWEAGTKGTSGGVTQMRLINLVLVMSRRQDHVTLKKNKLPFRNGYSHQLWSIGSVRASNLFQANFKNADDVITSR